MAIENPGFCPVFGIGPAVSARMSQLQTRDQFRTAGGKQRLAEMREAGTGALINEKLIRIRASIVTDSDCLSTPDQLRPAEAEIAPALKGEIAGASVRSPVPAFHRLDGEAVSDLEAAGSKRPAERRLRSGTQFAIAGNCNVVLPEMGLKSVNTPEASDVD